MESILMLRRTLGSRARARVMGVILVALLALPTAPLSAAAQGQAPSLTLYNAQHEDLVTAMVAGFTAETGITVQIRSGRDFEFANQIVQEGASSPADVFITE